MHDHPLAAPRGFGRSSRVVNRFLEFPCHVMQFTTGGFHQRPSGSERPPWVRCLAQPLHELAHIQPLRSLPLPHPRCRTACWHPHSLPRSQPPPTINSKVAALRHFTGSTGAGGRASAEQAYTHADHEHEEADEAEEGDAADHIRHGTEQSEPSGESCDE